MLVLSSYIRRNDLPQNTKKRKGTFRSLCASGRVVFHFHGRIPPCLSNVETILSQKKLFIKSSCALLRPVFRQTKTVRLFLFFVCGQINEPGFTPQAARCAASCKIPVSEYNKNPTKIVGFYGETLVNVNRILLSFHSTFNIKNDYIILSTANSNPRNPHKLKEN